MTSIRTRGFLFVLAMGSVLVSCSDDASTAGSGGTGGKAGATGGAATVATGGKASVGSGGAMAASGGAASASGGAVGTGGAASASGGAASASGGAVGTGGAANTGGATNAGGTGGGGAANPVAVATIAAVNGSDTTIAGTATFTQVGNTVTLVLSLTNCPAGPHASHLHENKNCGGQGASAAGGHWVNGEGLDVYTCTEGGSGMLEFSKPTTEWTVGGDVATDVTQRSFVVHVGDAGDRIGCGVIDLQ